jgi:hypothetical protein
MHSSLTGKQLAGEGFREVGLFSRERTHFTRERGGAHHSGETHVLAQGGAQLGENLFRLSSIGGYGLRTQISYAILERGDYCHGGRMPRGMGRRKYKVFCRETTQLGTGVIFQEDADAGETGISLFFLPNIVRTLREHEGLSRRTLRVHMASCKDWAMCRVWWAAGGVPAGTSLS